ncbi:AT-rich interactive domain-containing protein 3 [Camellia lanceoleosa]|uniref:AT-rich interactive domain-containing protein 3 n=1 Tax=Camellia lanceoleosa TaxID=1840588 RepID=A0ACC0IR03_9ERIC|nr:AT-rich interactive domain-containing protein 3 [Camellia lanceoleosa]
MVDSKTDDDKDTVKDTHDGRVTNDITMIDTQVEKEELSYLEEEGDTHLGNKDSSPQFRATQVENKESLLRDLKQNPVVATAQELHSEKAGTVADPESDANTTKLLQGNSGKADGTHLDPLIQSDSILPSKMGGQELNNGLTGMEFDLDTATKEEELRSGETGSELHPENEIKDKASNNEMTKMEFLLGNEIKDGELNVGVTKMELPPDTETKEEELHNGVTGMELPLDNEIKEELNNAVTGMEVLSNNEIKEESPKKELDVGDAVDVKTSNKSFLETNANGGDESGTEEEQAAFMKELETFHKERCLEFKPPRFYGEPLNCLKLWRAVIRLGGYEQVTSCKLWRQVGESFKPPKTCTTVSWTFRCFYEKALLEYEKHKMRSGELPFTDASFTEPTSAGNQPGVHQASGSGRARRDAAARAMQGWHSQRLLGNGEVGDPIIKDKNSTSTPKREKQLKSIGLLKRKKPSPVERAVKAARLKASKPQSDSMVVDIGPAADWVKINVQRTKDCFEIYALVPGLLREEVRVQSDPAGRLVISGQPEQVDNPWGVTPFKKVVSLPSRIDPHQTSAVVTLHGQLFVRVPFEQSDL